MTPLRLVLPYSTVLVDPESRMVTTRFPDCEVLAFRHDNDENRLEAEDQGYTEADAVWRSLQDHELAHNLCALWLWDTPSPTLRHEAGGGHYEYGKRLAEEGIVISFQRYLTSGDVWWPLEHYREQLPRWRARFHSAVNRMENAA